MEKRISMKISKFIAFIAALLSLGIIFGLEVNRAVILLMILSTTMALLE